MDYCSGWGRFFGNAMKLFFCAPQQGRFCATSFEASSDFDAMHNPWYGSDKNAFAVRKLN